MESQHSTRDILLSSIYCGWAWVWSIRSLGASGFWLVSRWDNHIPASTPAERRFHFLDLRVTTFLSVHLLRACLAPQGKLSHVANCLLASECILWTREVDLLKRSAGLEQQRGNKPFCKMFMEVWENAFNLFSLQMGPTNKSRSPNKKASRAF